LNILLMGNPNVGKSVIFSRLTGVRVVASNYPGTTVEFTEGTMRLGEEEARLIDVPGTYSLDDAPSKAEEVALRMIDEGDVIIDVVDATNLERNLQLTLELLERGRPMVIAVNVWDDALHKGILIDCGKLEEMLGVPVVHTTAITGEGIKELVERIGDAAAPGSPHRWKVDRWSEIGRIVSAAQSLKHRHHTFLEWLGDLSVRPSTGLPIAAVVLAACFFGIRFIGESLVGRVMEPLFDWLWLPVVEKLSSWFGGEGLVHYLLIGRLIDGEIDFGQSFGLLTTGIFIPLAAVLPYIIAFYLALGLLEDVGYLPRLAVLLDSLMHKMGLHGWAIIPSLLGLGCTVPAVMAMRILESRRERFIASTVLCVGIPCAALQARIMGLVGDPARGGGLGHVLIVYAALFATWLILGRVLNRVLPGTSPELLMEIPPYKRPHVPTVFKKLWMRMVGFVKEALPIVLGGVLIVNLLYMMRVFDGLAYVAAPVLKHALGLPRDAVVAIAVGFLRKDVAMGLLGAMEPALTIKQLVVASTVLAMSFPCIASFVVLTRELGWRDMLKATGIMIVTALVVGGILNLVIPG